MKKNNRRMYLGFNPASLPEAQTVGFSSCGRKESLDEIDKRQGYVHETQWKWRHRVTIR